MRSLIGAALLAVVLAAPVDAAGLTVTVTRFTASVARNSNATIAVTTKAGAVCSITVRYKSGVSTAAGLVRKTAPSNGRLSWTWRVGRTTTTGRWPVTIACKLGSASGTVTKYLTVT